MFDKDRYAVVVALLGMLGVEKAAQIPPERAESKLAVRLTKQGVPEGCTPEQKKVAEEILGSATPGRVPTDTELADEKRKAFRTTVKQEPTTKQPYRLTDGKDKDGPVEMLLPQMAEVRNKRRTDGKTWVHDPSASATKVGNIKPDPKTVKAVADKEGKKVKDKIVKKAVAKAKAKVEKKGKRVAKRTKESKTEKPVKAPKPVKPTKRKGKSHAGRKGGGAEVFRKIMDDRKPHKKEDVIKAIVKTGVGEASARAYLVWAKRSTKATNPAKGGNPFGIVIVETLDKNQVKFIQKK
jgi:hypothetical protein